MSDSRRDFLKSAGVTSLATAVTTVAAPDAAAQSGPAVVGPGDVPVALMVNGRRVELTIEPRVNRIRSARVVLGAGAPVPWRSKPAEEALAGKPLDEQTAAAAGEAAVSEAKPMSGNAYKVQIARTAVKRAIMKAAGMATA